MTVPSALEPPPRRARRPRSTGCSTQVCPGCCRPAVGGGIDDGAAARGFSHSRATTAQVLARVGALSNPLAVRCQPSRVNDVGWLLLHFGEASQPDWFVADTDPREAPGAAAVVDDRREESARAAESGLLRPLGPWRGARFQPVLVDCGEVSEAWAAILTPSANWSRCWLNCWQPCSLSNMTACSLVLMVV